MFNNNFLSLFLSLSISNILFLNVGPIDKRSYEYVEVSAAHFAASYKELFRNVADSNKPKLEKKTKACYKAAIKDKLWEYVQEHINALSLPQLPTPIIPANLGISE